MLRIIKCIALLLLFGYNTSYAQTIANATALYNEFMKSIHTSGESITAYNTLYRCYEQYWGVLNKNGSDIQQAKTGLKNIFPHLNAGAYYFTRVGKQSMVEEFAKAYIGISMHSAMQGEELPLGTDYPTFAWMAATDNFNSKKYESAIICLQAYINSGEVKKRADAYRYMAKSYEKLNDIPHALYILEQGLILYPDDTSMLASAINILGANKSDDSALQQYITRMMRFKPNDEGLINIQAQLYERTRNYEQAATTYSRLRKIKPQSLEVARHLSVNYYNTGVAYAQQASNTSGKTSKKHKQTAQSYFQLASKVLEEVLYSDPLAINYAYALANAYAYIGDTDNLQSINNKIQTLGYTPATAPENNMQEIAYTSMSSSPNLMAPIPEKYAQNQPKTPTPNNDRTIFNNIPQKKNKPTPTKSDVDIDIPINKINNVNTFAIIIANEKYDNVSNVPNAENDGNVFAEYCNKVLGIPTDNIRNHKNLTFGGILGAIDDMKAIAKAKHGNCKFIFYYAGHGIPDESTKKAYILPTDADGKQMRICYPLSDLYSDFNTLQAQCVTVFIDACFSGATRNVDSENNKQEMLFAARGTAIKPREDQVNGNVVIFSAASDNQTALSYDDKNHGFFTYFLLKKLKETKGDVSLQELGQYIIDEVSLNSQLKNHKSQTPTVTSSYSMGDNWKTMKLK